MKVEIECAIHGKQMLGVSCGLCGKTETEVLKSRLSTAEAALEGAREALLDAEHELTTLHNLDASDDPERLMRNPFTIDTTDCRDRIGKALASLPLPAPKPGRFGVYRAILPVAPKKEGK